MVHRLTPQFILDQAAQNRQRGSFDALCLFVDISGFTPLTLALMEHGTEGAEVLASVLDAVFEPLIDAVYLHGGFIAGFAGDAFKALFPLDQAHACDHALAAAATIRSRLTASPFRPTRFGAFSFSGKACLAVGSVNWEIWAQGDPPAGTAGQQAAYLFGGPAIQAAMDLDPLADQGELLVADQVIAGLHSSRVQGRPATGGVLVERVDDPIAPPGPSDRPRAAATEPAIDRDAAARFYPQSLLTSTTPGEFRRVTTVFLNFETPVIGAAAPRFQHDLFALLNRYAGFLCRVGQIGGKDNGQTLLLFWGAPTTAERDSARALGFILDLQAASPVRVRAGVTTALVFAGFVGSGRREEYTCHGSYVNLAARQMVAAGWGEIWVDATTATRTTGYDLSRHGEFDFKGFAAPQPVYRLNARVDAARRAFYAGTLVGRTAELAQLRSALDPLRRGAFGGLVLVAGEAGIGKSRLVHEAMQLDVAQAEATVSADDDYRVTLLQTDEILRRPLNPIRYGLRTLFRRQETESEADARDRFEAVLQEIIGDTPDPALAEELFRARSFLAALVDIYWDDSLYSQLEPDLRYENTLRAVKTLICALSLQQPQVLLLEDVHWLDSESLDLLQLLVRNVEAYPFLIVATQRTVGAPDPAPDNRLAALVDRRITLTALDAAAIQAMGADLLGGPMAASLAADLAERADGNPFFAEQIIRYLQEEGLLEEGPDGRQYRDASQRTIAADLTALTGDVRTVLTARLDRLSADLKEAVQRAAVLGREFDTRVLHRLLDMEEGDPVFSEQLAAGEIADLWRAVEPTRYVFRHGLLRETAYDMQLRSRLRDLHGRAGAAVQAIHAAALGPHYANLAYHYRRAEDHTNECCFAQLAGDYAAEEFANEEALHYYGRVLHLTPVDHVDARFQLLIKRAGIYDFLGDRSAQSADLDASAALLTPQENPGMLADVTLRRANLARVTNQYDDALTYVDEVLAYAAAADNSVLAAEAHNVRGRVLWRLNRYDEAEAEIDIALATASADGAQTATADNLYHLGLIAYNRNRYDRALALITRAADLYHRSGGRKGEVMCQSMFGIIYGKLGRYAEALPRLESGQKQAQEMGWRYVENQFMMGSGFIYTDLGAFAQARALHTALLDRWREIEDPEGEALSLDALGVIAARRQSMEEAESHFSKAEAIQRQIKDQSGLAYTLNHRGQMYCDRARLTAAESDLGEAADIRRSLAEHGLLLDCRVNQARLKARSGAGAEATAIVAEAVEGLSAGYDEIIGAEYPVRFCVICHELLMRSDSPELHRHAQNLRALAVEMVRIRTDGLPRRLVESYVAGYPSHRHVAEVWGALDPSQ